MNQFISTSIPYVNASPHIGFALELFLADSVARAARLQQSKVNFLCGTDDHSLKNALAAEQAGVSTRELVDANAQQFYDLCRGLGISNDDFISTSKDPRHRPAVEALWRACATNGDIYSAPYEGWYCVGCEQFIEATDASIPVCPEHSASLEFVQEQNYFFRLSRYQELLCQWLDSGDIRITPAHRLNEVRRFLDQPLADLSISRSTTRARGWGIPVPDDPTQVIYVWFDALANYISASGYGQSDATRFDRNWQHADNVQHVIGKGVTRFHAVYWPAILHSAGLRLPNDILVHGYVTLNGEKISKSAGHTIDPLDARDECGLEALRYYLLRHVGSHHDGDFTYQRLHTVYESELANQLGNLLARVVALQRKHNAVINTESNLAGDLVERSLTHVLNFECHHALREIWDVIAATNAYVSSREPWKLAKTGSPEELDEVLGESSAALVSIGQALAPLLPQTSASILNALQHTGDNVPQLFPRSRPIASSA